MYVEKPTRNGAAPVTARGPEGVEREQLVEPRGAGDVGERPSDRSTAPATITARQEGRWGKHPNLSLPPPSKVLSVPPIG